MGWVIYVCVYRMFLVVENNILLDCFLHYPYLEGVGVKNLLDELV